MQLETICCCVSPGLPSPEVGDPAWASAVCAEHGGHRRRQTSAQHSVAHKAVLALAKRLAGARLTCTNAVCAYTQMPLSSKHKRRWPSASLTRVPCDQTAPKICRQQRTGRVRWGALKAGTDGEQQDANITVSIRQRPSVVRVVACFASHHVVGGVVGIWILRAVLVE